MCIDLELGIKIGAFIISLFFFIKGICEYAKAQKWKRVEFVSKEIKDFQNDFDIKRAMILLDYDSNELELNTNEIEGKNKICFKENNLIMSALQSDKNIPVFSDEEKVIRRIFDRLFDRLTMFDNYIETGLIKVKDIKPYLTYWIEILADIQNSRKPSGVRDQIWKYIDEYRFYKIRTLCNRFGFNDK